MRLLGLVLLVAAAVTLAGCGDGSLSVTEYAEQTEYLVKTMEGRFAALDAEWESAPPTPERAADYWDGRLQVRDEFLEGVLVLDPPADLDDLHAASIDLFERITAADEAMAAQVATLDTIDGHWDWVDTPEGRASDAILEEVFAFCRSSQAEFDATGARQMLQNVWVPPDVRDVVKVAFGCPP